jgi:hypothetical protein
VLAPTISSSSLHEKDADVHQKEKDADGKNSDSQMFSLCHAVLAPTITISSSLHEDNVVGQRQISVWFPLVATPTCRLRRVGQAIRYLTFMMSFLNNGQSAKAKRVLHGDFCSVLSLKQKPKPSRLPA